VVFVAENYDQRVLREHRIAKGLVIDGRVAAAEVSCQSRIAASGQAQCCFGLAFELDWLVVGHVEPGFVETDVGANLPGEQWMLLRGIAADEQDRRSRPNVAHARRAAVTASEGANERGVVRGALVVDVVRVENGARELL